MLHFLRKIFHTSRVNCCFKYHKCNFTLRCLKTTSKILQFFCYDYFEDLLAPATCAKNFDFLADVVSKIFTEMHFNHKISFCVMHLQKAIYQRWSPRGRPWPRGQILKSLALALALASRPQVLENWPVLGSRTALLFGKLKFCGAVEKFFGKRFFVEIAWKIFVKTFFFFFFFFFGDRLKNFCEDLFFFFFLESTCALCPWSLTLALASDFFCVLGLGLGLEPCVLDSTSAIYYVTLP